MAFLVDKGRPEDRAARPKTIRAVGAGEATDCGHAWQRKGGMKCAKKAAYLSVPYMLLTDDAVQAVCNIYCQSGKKFDGLAATADALDQRRANLEVQRAPWNQVGDMESENARGSASKQAREAAPCR